MGRHKPQSLGRAIVQPLQTVLTTVFITHLNSLESKFTGNYTKHCRDQHNHLQAVLHSLFSAFLALNPAELMGAMPALYTAPAVLHQLETVPTVLD